MLYENERMVTSNRIDDHVHAYANRKLPNPARNWPAATP
jgi:hypothetical protein